MLGFGRIGQLVAARARRASACTWSPSTRSSSAERYRELGVEKAESPDELYARGRLHHAAPAQDARDRGLARTPRRSPRCATACAIINCARGELVVDEDLKAALDSGKVAGAALDVFTHEPITEHPLFGYPNVVVTPHLGASTAEAQDRAGVQTAEQVVAALTGGVVSTAVNIPAVSAEDMEVLGPFVPLAQRPRAARRWRSPSPRRRARRDRVPRPHRRARHAPAHARGPQRPAGRPHRGGGQPRQRAVARRRARDRGVRAPRAGSRATSPTSCG